MRVVTESGRAGSTGVVRHGALDLALALTLCVAGAVALVNGTPTGNLPPPPYRPVDGVAITVLVLLTAPLAVRRRRPVVVLAVVAAAHVGRIVLAVQPMPADLSVLIALYTATIHASGRARVAVVTCCVAALATTQISVMVVQHASAQTVAFRTLLALLVAAAGAAQRTLGNRARRMADDLGRAERDREAAERSIVAERARLARELHDVVTHGVTAMIVQADAAQVHLRDDRRRARAALESISASGRGALAELRQLLTVLQPDAEASLRPSTGLDGLGDLIRRTGADGSSISLSIEGDPRPVPADIELSAFRIVQESLTNAMQHGSVRRGDVVLRYAEECLEVEVCNDGPGAPAVTRGTDQPGGHGLTGMRDRAALLGGRLEAGPRPGGGYRVHAVLPLSPER